MLHALSGPACLAADPNCWCCPPRRVVTGYQNIARKYFAEKGFENVVLLSADGARQCGLAKDALFGGGSSRPRCPWAAANHARGSPRPGSPRALLLAAQTLRTDPPDTSYSGGAPLLRLHLFS